MLGVKPEECVFVDDLKSHCDAAEAVGMTSILVSAFVLNGRHTEGFQVRPGKSNDAVQELGRLLHLTPASRSSSQMQLNGHADPLSSLSSMLNGYGTHWLKWHVGILAQSRPRFPRARTIKARTGKRKFCLAELLSAPGPTGPVPAQPTAQHDRRLIQGGPFYEEIFCVNTSSSQANYV